MASIPPSGMSNSIIMKFAESENSLSCMHALYKPLISSFHNDLFSIQANELFSRNASQSEVDDLLVSLAEATSVNATGDSTIFPQGLSITNTIVKSSVNYLVQNVETASPMSSLNFSEVRL